MTVVNTTPAPAQPAQPAPVGDAKIADGWTQDVIGGKFPAGALVSTVARKEDHIDAFICGSDGKVYNSYWATDLDWSGKANGWGSIGGDFTPGVDVTAVARGPTNLDVFVVGKPVDGADSAPVYMSYWYEGADDWSGNHHPWASLGGSFKPDSPITAIARTANNLDLFGIGVDGAVYTTYWYTGGDWQPWRAIGGSFSPGAKVTAVARTSDNLDLFVCGADGKVYHSYWFTGGDWSGLKSEGWGSLGGSFSPDSDIAAVARSPNNLDAFVVDADGNVRSSYWYTGGSWSGINTDWGIIGSTTFAPKSPLTVISRGITKLDLFVSGSDTAVSHSMWEDQKDWGTWEDVISMSKPAAKVTAVARTVANIDVFVCDSDGNVNVSWHADQ